MLNAVAARHRTVAIWYPDPGHCDRAKTALFQQADPGTTSPGQFQRGFGQILQSLARITAQHFSKRSQRPGLLLVFRRTGTPAIEFAGHDYAAYAGRISSTH